MVLGKFSSLLIKENIINPETDNSALFKAMGNVVHNISQPPVEKKKPVLSSVDFIKGPLANLISKHEKSQNRIEEMRKKKYIEEVSQLKEKPTISSFSKRMVRSYSE